MILKNYFLSCCFNYQGYHPHKSEPQQKEAKYFQIHPLHHFSWSLPFGIVLEILT